MHDLRRTHRPKPNHDTRDTPPRQRFVRGNLYDISEMVPGAGDTAMKIERNDLLIM